MSYKTLFCLLCFLCCSTLYAQQGWVNQTSGTTFGLNGVTFLNVNTGYVVGANGIIKKTTNGGTNWISQRSFSTDTLLSVYFINTLTGTLVGGNGTVRHTTDGGNNWIIQNCGSSGTLRSVQFVNSNTGYIVGAGGDMRKTTNGGSSWTSIVTGTGNNLWSCDFLDVNTGYIVGFNGTVKKTTNGGTSWISQSVSISSAQLTYVKFINTNTGFIGVGIPGGGNGFYRTTNGGVSWVNSPLGSVHSTRCINFVNANTGMMVGDEGDVFRTTNSGMNWIKLNTNIMNWLNSTSFVNGYVGWTVGTGGLILKTTTGGSPATSIDPTGNTIPDKFALYNNYPNPFNPITKIRLDIPAGSREASLKVYDITGKEIAVLFKEKLNAGIYEVEWNGNSFASGVYFYKLETEGFNETKKMLLVK